MKLTVTVLMSLLSVALMAPTDPYKQKHYKPAPKPYNFAYGVNDPYLGIDYSRKEESDGNLVQGSYSVQLPDGRKQTVNYKADHNIGYHADVVYEGKAQYPPKSDEKPFVVQPSKGYSKPEPSYH